jgi:hypothetical protein
MATRHRLTAAAAVAGVLAIAAPAVHASADTSLGANASTSAVGTTLSSQIPVLGDLQAGANATQNGGQIGGQIDANAGLDSLQAAVTASQDAWRVGADAGLAGMRAGATAGVHGLQAGATTLQNLFQQLWPDRSRSGR